MAAPVSPRQNIVHEIARCVAEGQRIVVLHGGSDLTNTLSEHLGHPVRMITSPGGMVSRYTDSETLRIYAMAVAGQINTELVACLQQQGINALGLAGVDGRLLLARRKSVVRTVTPEGRTQILRDDYTGQIEQVNNGIATATTRCWLYSRHRAVGVEQGGRAFERRWRPCRRCRRRCAAGRYPGYHDERSRTADRSRG